MSFEPLDYLRHVLVEADYLLEHSADLTADDFLQNDTLQRAFVRSLQIIGEAAKQIPEDFRARHPVIDWRGMTGMRDRLCCDSLRAFSWWCEHGCLSPSSWVWPPGWSTSSNRR
jgi:uncharacterized protein with HEPN domain